MIDPKDLRKKKIIKIRKVERRIRKIEEHINKLRQKYGMDSDEFFELVESNIDKLLKKGFDPDEVLEDSLIWEDLIDEMEGLKVLLQRIRTNDKKVEEAVAVDMALEEKYKMSFEDFYDIVESLRESELVERGFDWDEIYDDFDRWLESASVLGKLRSVDKKWKRLHFM